MFHLARMSVNYGNGDVGYVRGTQLFYMAPVEGEVDGQTMTLYRLEDWRDPGFSETPSRAGTQSTSWGSLKASQ